MKAMDKMENEPEIPKEYCPYCGKNLIRILSEQEQKKYNLLYVNEKIGISNWDSVICLEMSLLFKNMEKGMLTLC